MSSPASCSFHIVMPCFHHRCGAGSWSDTACAVFQRLHLPLICCLVTAEPAPGFQPPKTTAFWLHQGEQSCRLLCACTLLRSTLHAALEQTPPSLCSCQIERGASYMPQILCAVVLCASSHHREQNAFWASPFTMFHTAIRCHALVSPTAILQCNLHHQAAEDFFPDF